MANIFLDANDTFTLPSTNENDTIFGRNGGTENVILQGNPVGTKIDGNVEIVQLASSSANTTLQINATTGQLELVSGGNVIATFIGGFSALDLRFTDGNVTLSQTGGNSFSIANPADATNSVTIDGTSPQVGSAVTLGTDNSVAGGPVAPVAGQTFTLTDGVNGEILVGTAGDDTFSGSPSAFDANDQIIDSSTTDNDTYNLTVSASATPKVTNAENVNVTTTTTNGTDPVISASEMSGVKVLTVTGGDVVVGGSTIAGDNDIIVTGLDASKVGSVVTGAGTKDATVTQATKAGATVDASTATGAIVVTGATTLSADNAAGTVTVNALANTTENAKAVVVNAAKATTVTTAAGFTGAVTVNAANAGNVFVNGASGGATVNAQKASADIDVFDIDDTGATITAGAGTQADTVQIRLDGTDAGSDKAAISASGKWVDLDTAQTVQVENISLSGNGADVVFNIIDGLATSYTATGTNGVTIKDSAADLDGVTFTDSSTGTTVVELNGAVAAKEDLSKIAADVIRATTDLATNATDTIELASGANFQIGADQTDIFLDGKTTDATLNVATADDTNASGATIDLTVGVFNADTNVKTLNLDATVGKFTATDTTLGVATDLVVAGSKDVTLGNLTAKSIDATASTGKVSLDTANTQLTSIKTGGGNDTVTVDQAATYSVDLSAGNNTLTISTANNASSFATGSGNDTIAVDSASSIVVVTGGGNDKVTIAADIDSDAILVAGDGTSDQLVFADTDGNTFSNNTNFNFTGFETLDISALTSSSIQISAAQFNNQTFTLKGNSATVDNLRVVGSDTAADTIDASNVTVDTALLTLTGGKGNDIITGSGSDDVILFDFGADVISGGAGSDTLDASTGIQGASAGTGSATVAGVIVNLGTSAVSEASIQAETGQFLGGSATEVASGTANLGYTADLTANISEVDTLSGILKVVGTAGADYIVGNAAGNTITGGGAGDFISLGAGADSIVYTAVAQSNSAGYDDVNNLNVDQDTIDLDVTVAAVNTTVAGTASAATLVADLNTLLNAGGGAGFDTGVVGDISAALVTVNAGDLNGTTFLAVDADASNTFTAADYLIDVTGITGTLATADFV